MLKEIMFFLSVLGFLCSAAAGLIYLITSWTFFQGAFAVCITVTVTSLVIGVITGILKKD